MSKHIDNRLILDYYKTRKFDEVCHLLYEDLFILLKLLFETFIDYSEG